MLCLSMVLIGVVGYSNRGLIIWHISDGKRTCKVIDYKFIYAMTLQYKVDVKNN